MSYLTGYDKRITLNINSTLVNSALTHFPIYVNLSSSSGITGADVTDVFDVVEANWQTIAFTESDGLTRLYAEVVSWDAVAKTAELWVSSSTWIISDSVDTTIFLYYGGTIRDSTYIGLVGSNAGEAVWDANFKLVCHMNDNPNTSAVMDSTSNDNDGTKKAANEPIESMGKIGKGQQSDGADDIITVLDADNLDMTTAITIEFWIQPLTITSERMMQKNQGYGIESLGAHCILTKDGVTWLKQINSVFTQNIYSHIVWTRTDDTTFTGYHNGVSKALTSYSNVTWAVNANNLILCGGSANSYHGVFGELRISNIPRSSAWVGASYETQRDYLITYTPPEPPHSRTWTTTPQIFTKKEKILIQHNKALKKFIEFLKTKRGLTNV